MQTVQKLKADLERALMEKQGFDDEKEQAVEQAR